jgi:hypothetical protein
MSPKSFIVLSLMTATALVAALVMIAGDRVYRPAAGAGNAALPGLLGKANDVASILIEHAGGAIALTSGEAGWTVKQRSGYAARTVKIKRSILGLAQLTLKEPKTRLKQKFAKLELQDPAAQGARSKRVRLFDKAGREIGDLIVGKNRPGRAGRAAGGLYVRKPGEDQAWLAAGATDLSRNIIDWLERKIVHVDAKRVKRVVINHPDGEAVEVVKATAEESLFSLNAIPSGKKLLSILDLTSIGKALANLVLDDVRKATDVAPFDAGETTTIDVTTFDGLSVRVRMVKRDAVFWYQIDASGTHEEAAKINARTKGWVYRITDYTASPFTRRMKDLVEDAKPKSRSN